MLTFFCNYCCYNTNKKSSIIYHLSRKYKCSEYLELIPDEKIIEGLHYKTIKESKNINLEKINSNQFRCKKCGKLYRHISSYYVHSKKCLVKSDNKEENNIVQNDIPSNNVNNISNIYNDNTKMTIINNTQNLFSENISIHINPYGKEDLSYIDKKVLSGLINEHRKLGDDADILYNYSRLVHFNDEHPENKNIQIINLDKKTKELLIKIFEGSWKIVKGKDLVERMAGEKIDQIDEHSKRLKLPLVQHSILNEYLDNFSYFKTEPIENKLKKLFHDQNLNINKNKKEYIWNGYKSKYLMKKQENNDKIQDDTNNKDQEAKKPDEKYISI